VELWDHGTPDDVARNDVLSNWLLATTCPVATGNVHYATPDASRRRQRPGRHTLAPEFGGDAGLLSSSPLAHLRSDAEQRRRFARWPGVVDRAGELASELAFDLRLVAPTCRPFRRAGMDDRRT